MSERIAPYLQGAGHVPLLIGGDCSIVVGTTQALVRISSEEVHVLYFDGDFDDAAPDPERCLSGAAVAVWLLTHRSPFLAGPPLSPSQVKVIGRTNASSSEQMGTQAMSMADVRCSGAREAARQILEAIPTSAQVLLHFDVDVLRKLDMPAAYFPHTDGLALSEGMELLAPLLGDPRIRIIEVTEYAALRDLDQRYVSKLVDLLAEGLALR